MGGEKTMYFEDKYFCRGSPPRRRGKEGAQLAEKTGIRITPAWAGKRFHRSLPGRRTRDHPRVGGEKRFASASLDAYWGSPPRGRGKGGAPISTEHLFRITPAWAGKRLMKPPLWSWSLDHPRVGGEKCKHPITGTSPTGSPPRGRGKDRRGAHMKIAARITPAWAGKSTGQETQLTTGQDHPRIGGESR